MGYAGDDEAITEAFEEIDTEGRDVIGLRALQRAVMLRHFETGARRRGAKTRRPTLNFKFKDGPPSRSGSPLASPAGSPSRGGTPERMRRGSPRGTPRSRAVSFGVGGRRSTSPRSFSKGHGDVRAARLNSLSRSQSMPSRRSPRSRDDRRSSESVLSSVDDYFGGGAAE